MFNTSQESKLELWAEILHRRGKMSEDNGKASEPLPTEDQIGETAVHTTVNLK